ncbi:MAG: hypothetical protein WC378_16920, partial [Opitutaceae bacterium]
RMTPLKSLSWAANPSTAPMKPMPTSPPERAAIPALGAHPNGNKFGCNAAVARKTRANHAAFLI